MTSQRNNAIPVVAFIDAKKCVVDTNSNQPRSRVSSLSSFFSTNSFDEGSHEMFGFRRFARSYLVGSEKSGKKTINKPEVQCINSNWNNESKGTYVINVDGLATSSSHRKSTSAQKSFGRNMNPEARTNTQRLNVNGELVDYELDVFGVPQKIPDLFKEECGTDVVTQGKPVYSASSSEEEPSDTNLRPKSIILERIPRNTGLGSILSQVCGGPLERVEVHRTGSDATLKRVELRFLTNEGARSFMKFGRTNMFKINGIHLNPEWGKCTDAKGYFTKGSSGDSFDEDIGICRCLVLKKYITTNKKFKHGENIKGFISDSLDVAEIKRDFGISGEILEIAPIVSRKLCISISYYSIDSAMRTMDDYENPNSYLHKKYFRHWAVWYGKDITDRPCIEL